ncbi:MAG: entericidin EcnAB [Azonexus sp.]|jgi:predicted small secreted protein|nr:entericidin EcnAB [Azonexus sp.]
MSKYLWIVLLALGLAACSNTVEGVKKDAEIGVEKTGEVIRQGGQAVGEALKKSGEAVQDAVE